MGKIEIPQQLIQKAKQFTQAAQYQQAIPLLMRAALLFQEAGEWEQYVDCCHQIADNHSNLSKYMVAVTHLEKAIEVINNKLNFNKSLLIATYIFLGDAYECLLKIDEAISYYQEALQLSLQLFENEKQPQIAELYGNIGYFYHEKGDYTQALTYQQRALTIYLKTLGANHSDTAICYNNLGNTYGSKGDYTNALFFYKKALSIWLSIDKEEYQLYIANVYNNLAYCLHHRSAYQKAVDYYQQAVEIYVHKFGEKHLTVAKFYNNIGKSLQLKGELQKSLEYYQKTLDIRLQLLPEDHLAIAQIYGNFGSCYTAFQDYSKALFFLQKSLIISEKRESFSLESTLQILNKIGHVYREQKQYQQALPYFHKVLQQTTPSFKSENIFNYPNLIKYNYVKELLYALNGKASCFYYDYQQSKNLQAIEAAYNYYQCLLQLLDDMRKSYKVADSKLILAQNVVEIYEKAIQTALILQELQPDRPISIFSFFEKSKSLVLLSDFKQKEAQTVAKIPVSLLEKERQLRIALTQLDQQIQKIERITTAKQTQQTELHQLQSQHFDHLQAYQRLIEHLEKDYPTYYQLKYNQKTVSIVDVQRFCKEQSKKDELQGAYYCVLAYFVGAERIYCMAINSTDYQVISIEKPSDFEELVEDFNYYLENALTERKNYLTAAYELYQLLVAPLLQSHKTLILRAQANLIIIPHGILTSIPFEAMLYEKVKKTSQYPELPYILNRYNISYHYSATLLLHCHQLKNNNTHTFPHTFIGFAPVYQHLTPQNELKSTYYTEQNSSAKVVRGKNCLVLAHSEEEINKIANLLRQDQRMTAIKTVLHTEASEANFRKLSKSYQYIHIAAHGIVDQEQAELSGILFSPNLEGTDNENGMLYLSDTYNLQLKADLVVLSCCETGIGRLAKGEGMMAINRGFLYAGANHVVYTLFKIPDKASAELMILFYEGILKNKNYRTALTHAKRKMISLGGNAAPNKWAGFVLID